MKEGRGVVMKPGMLVLVEPEHLPGHRFPMKLTGFAFADTPGQRLSVASTAMLHLMTVWVRLDDPTKPEHQIDPNTNRLYLRDGTPFPIYKKRRGR